MRGTASAQPPERNPVAPGTAFAQSAQPTSAAQRTGWTGWTGWTRQTMRTRRTWPDLAAEPDGRDPLTHLPPCPA